MSAQKKSMRKIRAERLAVNLRPLTLYLTPDNMAEVKHWYSESESAKIERARKGE